MTTGNGGGKHAGGHKPAGGQGGSHEKPKPTGTEPGAGK